MKKTLLSLAFVLFGLSLSAADIVIDWTKPITGAPTTGSNTVKAYTLELSEDNNLPVKMKFMYQQTTTIGGSSTYQLASSKTNGFIQVTPNIKCSEIILKTNANNPATKVTVTVYNGAWEKSTSDATPFDNANAIDITGERELKIAVPDDAQSSGTTYTIKTTGSPTVKLASITFIEAATSEPSISLSESALSFAAPLKAAQTLTLKGEAKNIDGDIALSVDNEAFTVPSTITADQLASGFDVTFTAAAAGESTATLTLAAGELKETVALSTLTVAHEGTEADPLTVADVIALNNLNEGTWYVTGKIGDKSLNGGELDEPNKSSIILTGENDSYIGVNFTVYDDAAMEKLNIVDNSANIGKTVVIKGQLKAMYDAPGVWSPEYVSGLPDTPTGIAGIEADPNAPVEYFNLQGIRVANPENGLYIRRQGNKVTKVYVK